MVTVGVDCSSRTQPKLVGVVWGLAADWRLVCIHHLNRVYLVMMTPL